MRGGIRDKATTKIAFYLESRTSTAPSTARFWKSSLPTTQPAAPIRCVGSGVRTRAHRPTTPDSGAHELGPARPYQGKVARANCRAIRFQKRGKRAEPDPYARLFVTTRHVPVSGNKCRREKNRHHVPDTSNVTDFPRRHTSPLLVHQQ